jgi:hypothetical protein
MRRTVPTKGHPESIQIKSDWPTEASVIQAKEFVGCDAKMLIMHLIFRRRIKRRTVRDDDH